MTLGLGLRTDNLVQALTDKSPSLSAIRLSDLLGTMIANLLLRRAPALVPLHRSELLALRQAALGLDTTSQGISPAARAATLGTLKERMAERSLTPAEAVSLWTPAVDRFLSHTFDLLGTSLSSLPADLSPDQVDVVANLPGLVLE